MSVRIIFNRVKQELTKRTSELSQRVSGALTVAAAYSKKNAYAAACIHVTQKALRRADELAEKVPVLALVKKHLFTGEVAIIAAAWFSPVPGAGVLAIGRAIHRRHLQSRLNRRLTATTIGNG